MAPLERPELKPKLPHVNRQRLNRQMKNWAEVTHREQSLGIRPIIPLTDADRTRILS